MNRKILLYLSTIGFMLLWGLQVYAQGITTASVTGTVRDAKNEPVIGATVVAIHEPTGTKYGSATDENGAYFLPNVKVGGPYSITVEAIGYKTNKQSNISLQLGQTLKLNFTLADENSEIAGIEVVATKDKIFDASRTGASTNISNEEINSLPTISRGLEDFVRLTPQFSAQANGGLSFAGQNNRFNNVMIDGAVNNDVFGLNDRGTPGGRTGSQPVSLDAIKEIQVIIAPYDVRQSGFIGGGVNAVTRSGTNQFEGSVYTFIKNQDMVGRKIGDGTLTVTNFQDNQYGFRVGGPILKNKLFFFVNGEAGRRREPNLNELSFFTRNNPTAITQVAQELNDIRQIHINQFNYDPGDPLSPYDNLQHNNKIFGRLDFNLNEKHTFTLRHNFIRAFSQEIFRNSTTYSFPSSGYRITNTTNTTVFEVQSRFNSKMSNEFRVGYTNIYDLSDNEGRAFPSMRVPNSTIGTVITGLDRIRGANSLRQNLIEITDHFTWFKGKHSLLFGTRNEIYAFDNLFIQAVAGEWNFASTFAPRDPITGALDPNAPNFSLESGVPISYLKNYSRTSDPRQSARWTAAQFGLYVQDEWNVNERLRLTLGVRGDLPVMLGTVSRNRLFEEQFGIRNDRTPSPKVLWSPRIGFNWDVKGDGKTQVRGGTGIFAGRPPFVWLSNQYSNSGVDFGQVNIQNQAQLNAIFAGLTQAQRDQILSNPDYLPPGAGAQGGTSLVNLTNPDLRLPQVFRTSVGVDQRLPFGIIGTAEFIYTKTLNDMYFRNINLAGQQGILNNEGRPIFGTFGQGPRLIDPVNFTGVYVLENTNAGMQYSATAQLRKNSKNLFSNLAYTYSIAKDALSATNSVSASNFNLTRTGANSPNTPLVAESDFNVRHRVIAAFGYTHNWNEYGTSQLAMFYNGQAGNNYSYLVATASGGITDINLDGINNNELIYIPRDASEIQFQSYARDVDVSRFGFTNANGEPIRTVSYTLTSDKQWEGFNNFIESEKSLKNRRGQFAERNGAVAPWNHRFDVRFTHTINAPSKKAKHQVQITWDIINIGNLLNKNWGLIQFGRTNPIQAAAYDSVSGNIVYRFNSDVEVLSARQESNGSVVIEDARAGFNKYLNSISTRSVWQVQLGARYSF
jgi:outer membrane receptor for ferrienterochelin and colicin